MKRLVALFTITLALTGIVNAQEEIPSAQPGAQYGKAVHQDGAISVQALAEKLHADSMYVGKVEGNVVEVCKKKGCFIRVARKGKGDPILVRFKDYGFFMPQDIVGKTVVLEGAAKVKTVSVAQQQHFAEDAGKNVEDIAKITEPKVDINIVADGVVVVK